MSRSGFQAEGSRVRISRPGYRYQDVGARTSGSEFQGEDVGVKMSGPGCRGQDVGVGMCVSYRRLARDKRSCSFTRDPLNPATGWFPWVLRGEAGHIRWKSGADRAE